jgi:2-polyprenyl-6-methoxyphenol hydroxylase-like FAD-dependent oxidoreductase
MPKLDSNTKVLIIGAGPGGLALAQILRKQGVPFEIFERENSLQDRRQGWAVALME